MKNVKNIIVFDTEFVSFKEKGQPIQVALTAYKLEKERLDFISNFSCYIKLHKNIRLNKIVTEITGIDNEKLQKEGITLEMAQNQLINYLLDFSLKDTILLGWDVTNDLMMFSRLFNFKDEILDIETFRWADLSKCYNKLNDLDKPCKLKDACNHYELEDTNYHNAEDDVKMTTKLLLKMIETHSLKEVINNLSDVQIKKNIKKVKVS